MSKPSTRNNNRRRNDGPKIVRTYEVVLFPILDGEAQPELAHEPMLVHLSYKPGQEPVDRAGLKAKGEALGLAIRIERREHNHGADVDFDAASIVPVRERIKA